MISNFIDKLEESIIIFFMGFATLIIFLSILHRALSSIDLFWDFLSSVHFSWAQELCIYSFIWMAKFGAAYGVRTGVHLGVDVLVSNVGVKLQRVLISIGFLIGVAFTLGVAFLGARWVIFVYSTGQVSPDLFIPMWIVYLCIPLGSGLMCYRFLQVLWRYINTGEISRVSLDG